MLQCPNSQTLQHHNKISTRRPSRRLVLTIGHKSGDSAEERGEHDGGAIFFDRACYDGSDAQVMEGVSWGSVEWKGVMWQVESDDIR